MLLPTKYWARKHIWNTWRKLLFFSVAAEIRTSFIFWWLCNPHRDRPPNSNQFNLLFPLRLLVQIFYSKCWCIFLDIELFFKQRLYLNVFIYKMGQKLEYFQVYHQKKLLSILDCVQLHLCSYIVVFVIMLKRNVFHWQCSMVENYDK